MKLIPTNEFNKTVSKITDKVAKKRLDELLLKLEVANSLSEIPNTILLKGMSGLFRITTGEFRLLIKQIKNGDIIIVLVDYRIRNEKTYKIDKKKIKNIL
jgi:mRNA-degrading endonuclease RelE of RelBE toxin-antitoxin system